MDRLEKALAKARLQRESETSRQTTSATMRGNWSKLPDVPSSEPLPEASSAIEIAFSSCSKFAFSSAFIKAILESAFSAMR